MSVGSESVFNQIISLYNQLPAGGKPRDDEYTVLAAIYAIKSDNSVSVISMATGTKCIGKEVNNDHGCLLNDSHAEILVRRSFIRYLAENVAAVFVSPELANDENCPLVVGIDRATNEPVLQTKSDWSFHLYISDSPCGDASIYESNVCCGGITGAKLVATETVGQVGSLRTKSGRSDIKAENRTTSMSCSDKLCRWCFLGLQGAFLSAWLSNIYLSSISVDHDPSCTVSAQHEALARAITARLSARVPQQEPASTPQVPLPIILTHGGFSHGKAAAKFKYPDAVSAAADSTSKKRKRNPLSPCGFSINWQRSVPAAASCFGAGGHTSVLQGDSYASADHKPKEKKLLAVAGGTVEVTIAHSGALQGSVKKSIGGVSAASRLSRYAMRILFEQIVVYCGTHKGENALNSTGMQSTSFVISTKSGDNDGEHVIGGEQVAASSVLLGDKALTSLKDFSYSAMKKEFSSVEYLAAKKAFLEHPVFKDWLCDL